MFGSQFSETSKQAVTYGLVESLTHVHGVKSHKTVTRISIAVRATPLLQTVPDLGSGYRSDGGVSNRILCRSEFSV